MKERNKEAVILLGHGSRVPGASDGMEKVAEGLRRRLGPEMVAVCHMSMRGPHFPEVFDRCAAGGANKIIVIPYFLHAGLHILQDIPEMLREKARQYPQVEIILGKNLGYDDCLVDLVLRRLEESRLLPDVRELKPAADIPEE